VDLDISDAVFTLALLFLGGPGPACPDAADSNDSGDIDISDAVYTLAYLFVGGPAPPPPGPIEPGPDPTDDPLPYGPGDTEPPARAANLATSPPSGANDNEPEITVTGEPGATVQVFAAVGEGGGGHVPEPCEGEFSPDPATPFQPATPSGAQATFHLVAAPGPGVNHTFLWNSSADLTGDTATGRIRVTPSLASDGTPGQPATLPNVAIDLNRPELLLGNPLPSPGVTDVAAGDLNGDGRNDLVSTNPASDQVTSRTRCSRASPPRAGRSPRATDRPPPSSPTSTGTGSRTSSSL